VTENRSSYRHILKATSIFGGVQAFSILIGMVRVKFVALLLGTVGVGMIGLFNSPLQLILSITGLGIAFSAVRDISEAQGTKDQSKIAIAITTLRRWSWFTGLLGTVVTLALAPFLSQWSFGSREYTWAFIWLSVTLFIQTVSRGQSAILQGTRRIKDMAKASVYGSLIGLLAAVPLYYYFGVKGIVPSLIISAITGFLLSWYFSRRVTIEKVNLSYRETIMHGENMVKLGIIMTIIGIIGTLTGYVLNAFIRKVGGIDQVGLYSAGWSIILQSTDLVFAAMATDYFPRLSEINKEDSKIAIMVNQQAEMALIILAPILVLLISAMPLIIRLLYAPSFLPVVVFANWMVLGIILKGLVWSIGFIFPAKGDLKSFGIIEITAIVFNLTTNVIGYKLYGLEGLGISFIVDYIFGLLLTLFFAKKKYGFKFEKETVIQFIVSLLLVTVVFLLSYFIKGSIRYVYVSVVFIISVIYSLRELDKRVGIRIIINDLICKFTRKG